MLAASTGNHGLAVAHAARRLGVECTVLVPTGASPAKLAGIRRLGAAIETVASTDAAAAEREARLRAERTGQAYVSPYNDPAIIAGQGTIAVELIDQLADAGLGGLDAVIVAVGGGGLASGIATYLEQRMPGVAIVGASPANDAAMAASVAAGRIVEIAAEPTLSDGTAGGIEPGAVTFSLCQSLIDHWVTVSEAQIGAAIRAVITHHHQLVEGAAGVAVAALDAVAGLLPGARVAVISCGAHIDAAVLRRVLDGEPR